MDSHASSCGTTFVSVGSLASETGCADEDYFESVCVARRVNRMAEPNWKNRTLWTGRDNVEVMRGMNSECVDLIYLDPPFNSNAHYAAPIGSEAAGASFRDFWTFDDVDSVWLALTERRNEALHAVIKAALYAHGKNMAAYLGMMAQRLEEMRRILKPTGSIYLHCDPTASHYLKLVMDALFANPVSSRMGQMTLEEIGGPTQAAFQFENEITWRRATSHNDPRRYGNITDTILFYANEDRTWNGMDAAEKKSAEELNAAYPQGPDERGMYRVGDLTGPKTVAGGESGEPWQGFDPGQYGRCWSAPLTGRYAQWIADNVIPGYLRLPGVHQRLDALLSADMIVLPGGRRKWPGLKRYASADAGNPPQNLILKPIGFTNYNKGSEYVGYPTQKRLKLLEIFIKCSSNPGDVVFDPFCGCATTCVAAETLKRQWVGIDIAHKANELVRSRLQQAADEHGGVRRRLDDVIHRTDMPRRTDFGKLIPYRRCKPQLYGQQGGHCRGCNEHFKIRNLTVDHIVPRSKGGTDHIENLWLLCQACNSSKGTRSQAEFLRDRLVRQGVDQRFWDTWLKAWFATEE
ncbi:MAG: hypothetical protein F4210_17405 [Holophagales bacterium]|nr:hypothetical protein [Holophagales bacterium]